MRLGVIVSDYRNVDSTISRLSAERLGLILVSNGIYHATLREKGKESPLLSISPEIYALIEDLQTRGLSDSDVDSRIKTITYGDLVDLIFDDYEKMVWI
jgi:sulfur relay protein TusB/DsrH